MKITKFFEIEFDDDFAKNIFTVLKQLMEIEYGKICYENFEYTYGKKQAKQILKEPLKIKNTIFGEILISADKFSQADKELFKLCSSIISNLIKDFEISKIMKMQVDALQEGYLKLKQAEEVKTKFISYMSHELRTPLNSILGYSDLLASQCTGNLNKTQSEYINEIKISGLNLLEMINEILDMSKIESNSMKLNKSHFEIKQVISEVENIIQPLLKNIKIKKNIQNFTITADYQKLQQILLNLISNAIKFTKDEIEISTKLEDNYAIISVKDNGIGIKTEDFDKIFDKFEQLGKHKENSTGLGLAITKELVNLHGGSVFVESKINNGSKFIVKLPGID